MSAATKPLATIPFPSFAGIDFPRDYPVQIVGDGDVIPLKGRELLVFEIPDHAVGSLAFLDRKERILFSGDEFMLMGKKPERRRGALAGDAAEAGAVSRGFRPTLRGRVDHGCFRL